MKAKDQKQSNLRPFNKSEQEAVASMTTRRPVSRNIFRTVEKDDDGIRKVEPVHVNGLSEEDAEVEFESRVYVATGAVSHQVGLGLLTKASEALTISLDSLDDSARHLNMVEKAMTALEPRDEIEGQLISQLVVLHEQCMSWLGKAMRTDRVDFANI